ncbi:MAG: N-acetylmuramoyl-L-alanine amidase [Gammaproteobacteria bacterium]
MRYLVAVILSLLAVPAAALEVQNLRLWPAPDNSRAVFDLSAPVNYEIFSIDNPPRVIIDLKGTTVPRSLPQPDANHVLLRKVRYGSLPGATGTRVVFDVTRRVTVRSALLKPNERYGHRLLVEFTESSAEMPPAAVAKNPPPVPAPETAVEPAVTAKASPPPVPALPTPPSISTPVKQPEVSTHRSRDVIVAVDAGHGGEDPGAMGRHGTREKDVTLAIARRLADEINATKGMRAVLTRDGDYFIPLRDRIDKAREKHADLFISIHADSYKDPRVSGSSVYVLSQRGASSEAARWLADQENASDYIGGVTWDDKDSMLKTVLLDLSQTASMEASNTVAGEVLERLDRVGDVRKQAVQRAGFVVLKSPDIPSILVETAYLTNAVEEKKLKSAEHQKRLARAITAGILQYFQNSPPPGTILAEQRELRVANNP